MEMKAFREAWCSSAHLLGSFRELIRQCKSDPGKRGRVSERTVVNNLFCRHGVDHRRKVDIEFSLRIGGQGLMHGGELVLEVARDTLEIVGSIAVARHVCL